VEEPILFLETNVFLRHLTADHPEYSPRASAFFDRIQRGEVVVRITDTVVFETVFTLQSFYRVPRDVIRDSLLSILEMPGIVLPGKNDLREVFDLYVAHRSISYADCFHAVLLKRLGLTTIVSFDRDVDPLPDITRVEP
jgi:predicted nucleic acid-binding protein